MTHARATMQRPTRRSRKRRRPIRRSRLFDDRVDVFGLGCILFEILAGESLLPRRDVLAATLATYDPHPATRAPTRDIPPELDAACAAAVAPDRGSRPTARGLAEMIERFLDGDRDVAQRKKLASTHLEAARTALAAGDGEAERATAMRQAGRALGLDPTSGAAELLGRLMLEPPNQTPREVETRLLDLDDRAGRTKARSFLPAYVGSMLLLPVMMMIALHGELGIAAYTVGTLFNIASCLFVIYKKQQTTALDMYAAAFTNSVLILVVSWLFGPLTIAPGIAIVVMLMFSTDPRLRFGPLAVLTIVPTTLPWLLELFGAWHDVRVIAGDLTVHTNQYDAQLPGVAIALAAYGVVVIVMSGVTTHRLALNERAALRSVELQAWHLRQLVGA